MSTVWIWGPHLVINNLHVVCACYVTGVGVAQIGGWQQTWAVADRGGDSPAQWQQRQLANSIDSVFMFAFKVFSASLDHFCRQTEPEELRVTRTVTEGVRFLQSEGIAMPSDFISLFNGDLDLNSPSTLYSKGKCALHFTQFLFSVTLFEINLTIYLAKLRSCAFNLLGCLSNYLLSHACP